MLHMEGPNDRVWSILNKNLQLCRTNRLEISCSE